MPSKPRMTFPVRVNGKLAEEIGTSRINVEVRVPAIIQDVITELSSKFPSSSRTLCEAIPFVSGRSRGASEELLPGQEVTLLMPAAGG